jgi:hypothetical protein
MRYLFMALFAASMIVLAFHPYLSYANKIIGNG